MQQLYSTKFVETEKSFAMYMYGTNRKKQRKEKWTKVAKNNNKKHTQKSQPK